MKSGQWEIRCLPWKPTVLSFVIFAMSHFVVVGTAGNLEAQFATEDGAPSAAAPAVAFAPANAKDIEQILRLKVQ